jgi:hypothetical protein
MSSSPKRSSGPRYVISDHPPSGQDRLRRRARLARYWLSRPFKAGYPGLCWLCELPIRVGEEIRRVRIGPVRALYVHRHCDALSISTSDRRRREG